ncbi:MAG: non-hydrolyzing UDP-N-acetylglucosamine 2-epimerase [Rhodothalassiaceae bacterium]
MSALLLLGTRPEAIKMVPVALALRRHMRVRIILTGQHAHAAAEALGDFGLAAHRCLMPPAAALPLMRRLAWMRAQATAALRCEPPGWVLVHGDTASTLAGALAARAAARPLAHIEAGLRSGCPTLPWPEEPIRRRLATLAQRHYAPTPAAQANLLAEAVPAERIVLTGNTVIDALRLQLGGRVPLPADPPYLLATLHRRENWGAAIARLCRGLTKLPRLGLAVRLVLHPNPALQIQIRASLGGIAGVALVPPQRHPAFLRLLAGARLVLTDSGGVQEEAAALGRPVLVGRTATERGEAVAAGLARLIGTDPDALTEAVTAMLAAAPPAPLLYGDGRASQRIARDLRLYADLTAAA